MFRTNLALWARPHDSKKECDIVHYAPDTVLWMYKLYLSILGIHFCPHFVSNLTKSILLSSHFFPLLTVRESVWSSTDKHHKEHFSLISCHLPEPFIYSTGFYEAQNSKHAPGSGPCLVYLSAPQQLFPSLKVRLCYNGLTWSHLLWWLLSFWWSFGCLSAYCSWLRDNIVGVQLLIISFPTEM